MFRIIFGLIAALLMLSALKAVITSFSSILSAVFSPSSSPSGPSMPGERQTPIAQVLRRCASCGTFTPESVARKAGRTGSEIYFCSNECQVKGVAKAS